MDEETYGLNRLFRPQYDHLPIEEQLAHYHQKDLMPVHVYRVGMKVFGNSWSKPPIRRRVIDASCFLKPSLNKDQQPYCIRMHQKTKECDNPEELQVEKQREYKAWLHQRKELRENLDSIGANEKWLTSKQCTPIEAKLLTKLQEERRNRNRTKSPSTPTETSGSEDDELTAAELRRQRLRERKEILKDMRRLEKYLKLCRTRIAEFVVPYDTNKTYLIPTDILIDFIERLRPPVSVNIIMILCEALEKETDKDDTVDYRKLFCDGLESLVEEYLSAEDVVKETPMSVESDTNSSISSEISASTSTVTSSTLPGNNGMWACGVKENALKQFIALIEYCKAHNIVLNKKLAERGLLMPPDKTRKECLKSLRQPGTDTISRKLFECSKKREEDKSKEDKDYFYGWQYKEIRGPFQPKLMRLSTGDAKIKAKTDSWMTFAEFQELTKEIQSRPGFNYIYHGLPPDSAFWPGALQDKLRLHLSDDTAKTCSVKNIFQPVKHLKIYNPLRPSTPPSTTRGKSFVWQENESGHVQFGSSLARTKKTYIL
jgi:hypothetical protein